MKNIKILLPFILVLLISVGIGWFVISDNQIVDKEENKTKETLEVSDNLILNTDKQNYQKKERVYFQITSLFINTGTGCEEEFELAVTDPEESSTILKTDDGTISPSSTCGQDLAANDPDYSAIFIPQVDGKYKVTLKDIKNNDSTQTIFNVGQQEKNIILTRWGASKVTSEEGKRYPMKFTLSSENDISGRLIEKIPSNFEIVWQGPAEVSEENGVQTLAWNFELTGGQQQQFAYEYEVKKSDEKGITLGPAVVFAGDENIYRETNPWRVVVNDQK